VIARLVTVLGFLPVLAMTRVHAAPPLVVAHRGASAEAPENTAAAIRLGIEQGADLVEFDIRSTRDGIPILVHDEDLRRCGGRSDKVVDLDYETASQIDVGSWFDAKFTGERMIPLEEAVALCLEAGVRPLIERKTGTPEEIIAALNKIDALEKVTIIAFDWDFLAAFRQLSPKTPIAPLGKKDLASQLPEILEIEPRPEWVGWKNQDLDREGVEAAHTAGLKVNVWTVDSAKDVAKHLALGVDSITTNRPAATRGLIEAR